MALSMCLAKRWPSRQRPWFSPKRSPHPPLMASVNGMRLARQGEAQSGGEGRCKGSALSRAPDRLSINRPPQRQHRRCKCAAGPVASATPHGLRQRDAAGPPGRSPVGWRGALQRQRSEPGTRPAEHQSASAKAAPKVQVRGRASRLSHPSWPPSTGCGWPARPVRTHLTTPSPS